jgi:hypothetical protein
MKPTTREINKAIRLENEVYERQQAIAARKIAKLKNLTTDRGATPAEAENARVKADALRNKPKPTSKYAPPPLPKTAAEFLARRKGRKGADDATRRDTAIDRTLHWLARDDEFARLKQEVARLTAEVARLTRELAEARAAKPAASHAKPGRKPIGDRAMTAAERMRRMRLRNVTK